MFQSGFANIALRVCLMLTSIPTVYLVMSDSPTIAPQQPAAIERTKPASDSQGELIDEENYIVPGQMVNASSFGYNESQRLEKEGIFIGDDSYGNFIDLKNGNVLIAPGRDTIISVGTANIGIGSGATVFIIKSDTDVVVYNLHQTKPNDVSVAIDKRKVYLEPGQMFVLTQQNVDDFEKLSMNCHSVNYDRAKLLAEANQSKMFIADFSMTSALVTIGPLRRLATSNNAQDKLALQKLVKDAVILQESAIKQGSNL